MIDAHSLPADEFDDAILLQKRIGLGDRHRINLKVLGDLADRRKEITGRKMPAGHLRADLIDELPEQEDYLAGLVKAHHGLGNALGQAGQLDQAIQVNHDTVSWGHKLVQRFPRKLDYQEDLGRAQESLACKLDEAGKPPEAEKAHGEALDTLRSVVKADPGNRQYRASLANALGNLGALLTGSGRVKEAAHGLVAALRWAEE